MNSPRRQRGFFIVWGSRNRISSRGGSIDTVCPSCRNAAKIEGKVARRWFTLYFLPIFPMDKGQHFSQCKICKTQFRATIEEFRGSLIAGKPQNSFQQAIALFNELRETPTDSAKLHRLLTMYANLAEPREAVAAGKAYPQALESSDTCMTLMAQACATLGDRDAALKWSTTALALNPTNEPAHTLQSQLLAILPSPSTLSTLAISN